MFGTTHGAVVLCKVTSSVYLCSSFTRITPQRHHSHPCTVFVLTVHSWRNKNDSGTPSRPTHTHQRAAKSGLGGMLHFFFVAGILALVGSRVASLVVLEFCLRGVSGLVTARPGSGSLVQLLVQSQFTLGCALSSSLHFLHQGASQRWLCLLLAAALSWFLSRLSSRLQQHVVTVYRLHSSQRYCGICMGLRSWGPGLMPALCRSLLCTFTVAAGAAVSIINQHFLSATEALRFWTPLTICYTLLVVYMQEEQQRLPSGEAVLNTVLVRLGGLMVLMLTVGRWADVLHILMCFLGEASCLIPTRDLLDADPWPLERPAPGDKAEESVTSFKSLLKTHFYRLAFT
uniref:Transmembrane protein 82 n=1 Tax=Sphaeramia orbicularis TaxID=375764 RepID=A0A672YRF7_9TELE